MIHRFFIPLLILITGLSIACAGTADPLQPPDSIPSPNSVDFHFVQADENTLVLGSWEVYIDLENETIEAVPLRSAELHFNVTPMITPPKCYDCFLAKNLDYDPLTHIVTIDIGFRNPSSITGFDIRGIITWFGNKKFLNPDGYTTLFSSVPDMINPFVAYDTGVGQREYPAHSDQYETLEMYVPDFPSFQPFTYVVEASWPDNCKEPYDVRSAGISGELFSDGSNSPLLQVYAYDWQNNVESVSVDLAPVGGPIVSLTQNASFPDIWEAEISCASGTPVADYELLVKASSAAPFDQTADMYNYVAVEVSEPPSPTAEVFGPAERVAETPGESFVWPRHSIAVTSDGTSHVVWVDNSPDPDSNVFHVYYSKHESDIWTLPQQLDDENSNAIYATIAADSSDTLHVVWEDQYPYVLGSEICYSTSLDNFASHEIILPGDDCRRNVHPKIEVGPDGSIHLAWHSQELVDVSDYEYDAWYMTKPAGNPSWDGALSVAAVENIAETFPAITPRPDGSAYYAFQSDEPGIHGIYFTKNPGGTFSDPVTVVISDSFQPTMDVDPDGTILVAYFDYIDGTYSDILARRSYDGGDTWVSPWPVSDSQEAFQYAPDVECTSDGDYHFTWHEEDDMGRPGRVLYREYLVTEGWQDIIELVGSTQMGAFPSMDSDADGHIHVIYELFTLAEPPGKNNYDIWYRDSVE